MACGCGGSKAAGQKAAEKPPREHLRGPKAEGYYWNGPKRPNREKPDAA